jgi:hypothetical protein
MIQARNDRNLTAFTLQINEKKTAPGSGRLALFLL